MLLAFLKELDDPVPSLSAHTLIEEYPHPHLSVASRTFASQNLAGAVNSCEVQLELAGNTASQCAVRDRLPAPEIAYLLLQADYSG